MTITIETGVTIGTGVTISEGAAPAPGNYFLSMTDEGFQWTQSTGTLRFYGITGMTAIANAVNAGNIVAGQNVYIDNTTTVPPTPPFRYFGVLSSWDISNVVPGGNVYLYLNSPGSVTSGFWAAHSGIDFRV